MVEIKKLSVENEINHYLYFINVSTHDDIAVHFLSSIYEINRGTSRRVYSEGFGSGK